MRLKITLPILMSVVLATGLSAQTQPHSHNHPSPKAATQSKQGQRKAGMNDKKMMARCHEMMQKRAQRMADIKALDEKLDGLVATMNAATGSDKVEAIAAVVNEMAAQRKVLQEKRSAMQAGMMQHMMEHMQMGKQSLMMCPMMQAMQAPQKDSGKSDEHSQHH